MTTIKISLGSLGGTVSMTKEATEAGVKPRLTATDLIASVGHPLGGLEIFAENILQVPSSYITFEHVLQCYDWAKQQVNEGAEGIVLTQGTDTLEETAYLLDLLWDFDAPLVLMGAMRSPQQAGAEGPGNLLASLLTASSVNSRGRGVLVVMNNWIHEARWVQKNHTADVDAFQSQIGASGTVFENHCQYFKAPPKRYVFDRPQQSIPQVFLWEASLSDSVKLLDMIAVEYQGIVIAAFGAGHVSEDMANQLGELAQKLPIVVSSATLKGSTASKTYGYIGGEIDLQNKGITMSEWLSPKKARLLLSIILANGLSMDEYKQYLASLTY